MNASYNFEAWVQQVSHIPCGHPEALMGLSLELGSSSILVAPDPYHILLWKLNTASEKFLLGQMRFVTAAACSKIWSCP
jgi:hypothetical protein